MTNSAIEKKMAFAVCATLAPFFLLAPLDARAQDGDPSSTDLEAAFDEVDSQTRDATAQTRAQPPIELDIEASPSSTPQDLQQGRFNIGPVLISGNRALPDTEFLDIIERFSARRLNEQDLARLAEQVATRAHERGYVFASAWIDPQTLETGVLRVSLDEGTISEIRISGDDAPAIHAQLAPLLGTGPVTLQALERQILLADDLPGVWIRGTQFIREERSGILLVDASITRLRGYAELENSGTQTVGPYRARISADINGLLTNTDRINLTYSATPFQPDELQYGRLRYQLVVNSSGTQLALYGSYSKAQPGANLAEAELNGTSWAAGVNIRHPLVRRRDFSLWAEGELELRHSRQEVLGFLFRLDRVPVLSAGLFASAELGGGRFYGRLTYSRGLNILNSTRPGDPLASRSDASASFNKVHLWANWTRPLTDAFSLSLATQGQLSSDPLLISEDLGLGGRSFLRGYAYNQRSGENGVMGSAELRYDWNRALGLVRNMQIYAFADGGVVDNLDDGFGSGSLASSGGGVRTDITRNLDLDLEVAVPLTGPRYDTGDKDPQINFRVRQSF